MDFFNSRLNAHNVLEINIDYSIVSQFQYLLSEASHPGKYTCLHPNWSSDIKWISPDTLAGFGYFQKQFRRLDICRHILPLLDKDKCARMYSGFIVLRTRCDATNFHVDWRNTGNQAFTLLTPITPVVPGFGLLYYQSDGTVASYSYKTGKALIFGDSFLHSTQPGCSNSPFALLSFTFGTDKMKYWPNIALTTEGQGSLTRLPDGTFKFLNYDDLF